MINVKLDYKTVIAAALVGAGAVWIAKAAISTFVDNGLPDSINPVSESNFINRAFESVWQAIFKTGNKPGADVYDFLHGPYSNDLNSAVSYPYHWDDYIPVAGGDVGSVWDATVMSDVQ